MAIMNMKKDITWYNGNNLNLRKKTSIIISHLIWTSQVGSIIISYWLSFIKRRWFSISYRLFAIFVQLHSFQIFYHQFLDPVWKMSKSRVFSGPYFPVFGLNLRSKSPYSFRIRKNTGQKKCVWALLTQLDFYDGIPLQSSILIH